MTPAELADAVIAAVRRAADTGALDVTVPNTVVIERPKQKEHGDYATNVALQLAKQANKPPREVAEAIRANLDHPGIASAEIAGPGFLNFRLAQAALGELARTVVEQGEGYGRGSAQAGHKVNLEFVSANPTGPLHIGAVRWATVGDALARIWEAAGATVAREYYVNDAGAQIDLFAESLAAAAKGEPPPENGYHGEYVKDIAERILDQHPGADLATFRREGVALMLDEIKVSLAGFGVPFDVWFSEESLHASGGIDRAIERLKKQGNTYEHEGAIWLRTSDFGDDKDRVIVRADGTPTYFAADAAYYLDKRVRGFDTVVIMLGADHHGYVGRMRAMAACFGDDPDRNLEIRIGQLVHLVKGGVPVKMSKRAGTFVTMDDLVEAVGVDAARYTIARSSTDSPLDLDVDAVTRKDPENPVFYVQYAHARIASVLRNAVELKVERTEFDPALLSHEREGNLLRALGEFPRVVASAAELREPHRVARYLEELAGIYHRFYDACRVLPGTDGPDPAVTTARLTLCEATRTVLANGLGLLGVSAPERM